MTVPLPTTTRDQQILQALVLKVRLFSQRQVAEHWFQGDVTNTRRRLQRLADAGWLERLTVPVRTLPPLTAPLVSWQPGEAPPAFGEIAYQCENRWRTRPVRSCVAWCATSTTQQLFGGLGHGVWGQPLQASHDLGVAEVWLRLRATVPAWAEAWRGEDMFATTAAGEKRPDAYLLNDARAVVQVIEFGGGYNAERLEAFHAACAARELPYQVW